MSFKVIAGTDIDEIRDTHPGWTEEECREAQQRVAFAAFGFDPPSKAPLSFAVGAKIQFAGEKRSYTVKAASGRFAICTKPFNLRHTTLYTIVDLKRNVRGRENLIFGMGFETDEQCERALERLIGGESEVSYRHYVPLEIEAVI